MTGGADELGLTQSTVSAQVQSLERELGYRLFERSARGVSLTPRGRALLARVGGAVDAAAQALAEATGAATAEHTVLLGGPAELLSVVVLPRLDAWVPADVDVRIEFGQTADLLAKLQGGALDLVLSTTQPRVRGVAFTPLTDEHFVLVVPPALLERFRGDPDAVPVVAYDDQLPIIRRYWRTVFNRRPSPSRVPVTVPDLRAVADLAAAGVGMTVLPTYLAAPYLEDGRLVDPVDLTDPPLNTVYLAKRRTRAGQAPVTDAVAERITGLLRWSADR